MHQVGEHAHGLDGRRRRGSASASPPATVRAGPRSDPRRPPSGRGARAGSTTPGPRTRHRRTDRAGGGSTAGRTAPRSPGRARSRRRPRAAASRRRASRAAGTPPARASQPEQAPRDRDATPRGRRPRRSCRRAAAPQRHAAADVRGVRGPAAGRCRRSGGARRSRPIGRRRRRRRPRVRHRCAAGAARATRGWSSPRCRPSRPPARGRRPAPTAAGRAVARRDDRRHRARASGRRRRCRRCRRRRSALPSLSSRRDGSGSVHGRRGGAMDSSAAAAAISPTVRPTSTTRADWKPSSSPGPSRTTARPAADRRIAEGPASPTTSIASAASCRRSAIRRSVLVRISSLTTPLGRWVASTRCTPRLLPRRATSTSEWSRCGCSSASAANSSTTITSRGSTGASSAARAAVRSLHPWARSTCSRAVTSARRLRRTRSASRGSRSVTVPTTCGSPARSSNVAPPLKSTSTKARRSGGTRAAIETTSARRSSLLPDPVVPATSACGPSRTRSMSTTPSAASPSGPPGRGSAPASRHRRAMVPRSRSSAGASSRSSATSSGNARASSTGASGSLHGARADAIAAAARRPMPISRPRSTTTGSSTSAPSARTSPSPSTRSPPSVAAWTTAPHIAGTGSPSPTCTSSAASGRRCSRRRTPLVRTATSSTSSVTTSRCRSGGAVGRDPAAPDEADADHSDTSAATDVASWPTTPAGVRWTWGSPAAHDQRSGWDDTTSNDQSAGPVVTANCTTSDRTTASAWAPVTATRAPIARSTTTGAASRTARPPPIATDTGPSPTTAVNASPCAGRRSHSSTGARRDAVAGPDEPRMGDTSVCRDGRAPSVVIGGAPGRLCCLRPPPPSATTGRPHGADRPRADRHQRTDGAHQGEHRLPEGRRHRATDGEGHQRRQHAGARRPGFSVDDPVEVVEVRRRRRRTAAAVRHAGADVPPVHLGAGAAHPSRRTGRRSQSRSNRSTLDPIARPESTSTTGRRPASWHHVGDVGEPAAPSIPGRSSSRWNGSSPGSSQRTAASGDRPTTWRPGGRTTVAPASGPAAHTRRHASDAGSPGPG